jgi:predicted amidohydrolase YtcJ
MNQQTQPADVIFRNGNFYTVNPKQPRAQAVAVRNGRFLYVGSNAGATKYQNADTQVIDLRGRTVVPGMADSHYHLSEVGERERILDLGGTSSLQEFLNKVKERVQQAKPGEWITGGGWIETFWDPPLFPTRWDLDKVAPDNPVFLSRVDSHGGIANSLALKIAGITAQTPNPSGGEIMKDKATGEPDGMLLDHAQSLVTMHVPPGEAGDMQRALLTGVERSLALGWCQVQIAGNSYAEASLIRQLIKQGKIKLRIYNALMGPGTDSERLLSQGAVIGESSHRFTMRGIKLVIDGALGSKGAALLEPYNDHDSTGLLRHTEQGLMPLLIKALRNGIQIETHAIGDRANRIILDWYEKAFKAVPTSQRKVRDPRWRVEHAQILNPRDIPRFAKLGVIPSMQPSHAITDLHFAPSRLGIPRLRGAYAWKSLIHSKSIIAGGSDAPVEKGDPVIEFYAATVRKDLKGFHGEGWHREQRVSREDALKMFTLWAAYAAFEEKLRGTIEAGKLADLTVFERDLMRIPDDDLPKNRCLMTVVAGEVVYEA